MRKERERESVCSLPWLERKKIEKKRAREGKGTSNESGSISISSEALSGLGTRDAAAAAVCLFTMSPPNVGRCCERRRRRRRSNSSNEREAERQTETLLGSIHCRRDDILIRCLALPCLTFSRQAHRRRTVPSGCLLIYTPILSNTIDSAN